MKKVFYIIFVLSLLTITSIGFFSCKNKKANDEFYPFLRLGLQANTDSIEYYTALKFAEKVQEFSNGTVEIKIFPNGQFGDDIKMLKQVAAGTLDLTYAETGRLGIWVKEAKIFGYPFVFDNFEHLLRTIQSDYGKQLHKKFLEKGWRILATGYNGTRQTTSNKPINSIEDMKGMKLRVPKAKPNIKFAEYSGAIPELIPINEVYSYLKANIVDGQENPLSTIDSRRYYEVQSCCALTNHIINDNNIIISEKIFKLLSPEQQQAVQDAAVVAARYQTELFKRDEVELLSHMHEIGIPITTPDREPFRKACEPMYYEYEKECGQDAIIAIESTRKVKDN